MYLLILKNSIYRALDCASKTVIDILIRAIQAADNDGMDILNFSLGGDFRGWSDTPLGLAIKKMVDKGIIVVVAASEL